jgi:beta-galactosidase/beta-glucuronidase
MSPSSRLLLHIGACDYRARLWVNGLPVGMHEGGYTPFHFDITPFIGRGDRFAVILLAEDDPFDLAKPRGKQDWQLEPHSIWYPRTTGLWQTVWMEVVAPTRIANVRWTPNLERWEISLGVRVEGPAGDTSRLAVELTSGGQLLADDRYSVTAGEVHRRIALSDPGIDDSRNALLWSPHSPTLIHARLRLFDAGGTVIDEVRSYTALRSIAVQGDRVVLNKRPYQLRLVLDQGYWPRTGLTAPDDRAFKRDILLARAMGFNGVRKHQKIENPRYLYWADRLGLLVWEEMPSAYRFTRESVQRLTSEWTAVLERDVSHPSIIAWVPINESWGVPNLPDNEDERDYVRALYHLTRTLDPTRPVVGNDGWEAVATDIIGIHDYDPNPERIAKRYHHDEVLPRLLSRARPAGRLLVLERSPHQADQPVMLTEFGGIALGQGDGETWGYSRCRGPEEFGLAYEALVGMVRDLGLLSGFCYTQFADTYQEANGLLYADRTPKLPLPFLAAATAGVHHRNREAGDPDALLAAADETD